jgi:methionyl-tRNA formyltransferase
MKKNSSKLKIALEALKNFNPLKKRIAFLGTPEFAVAPLEALFRAKYAILGVITAPDKPVGRKQVLTPPAVKITAQKMGLTVYQPESKAELLEILKNLRPDLCVVTAFGMIFPKEALEIPQYGFINIHASLLPRWRGPSPIQAAIINGDEKTGVTIMLINEKMDEGPTLANAELRIQNSELTAGELSKKLSDLGAKLLIEVLPKYLKGEIKPQKQNNAQATYCKIIRKEDGRIDWSKPAEYIERQVKAYHPWPTAYAELRMKNKELRILKIIKAGISGENKHKIGEIFLNQNKKLAVKCGKGSLILEIIQPEGKKPMSGEEFLRGHREIIGSIF